jgi:uncharacterized protein YjbI with pentapeptide repeats
MVCLKHKISDRLLYFANLCRTNLYEANLFSANLEIVSMNEANLSGANLVAADLFCADLSRANLSGANLSHAKLLGVFLTKVVVDGDKKPTLTGAHIEDVDFRDTQIQPVWLHDAIGTPRL